ncbi:MAG: acetoacetate--CoA ligase [Betaproteobacteria bacterium]|nr:acetoacetate--CoA ligase [Betaproteobacteria bacterium]
MSAPPVLWKPSQKSIEHANLTRFAREAVRRWKLEFNSYPEFYRWSVDHPEQFWVSVWDSLGVIGERGARALVDGHKMPGAKWFPDARFNFAENLLKRSDALDAMVFWDETGSRGRMNWKQLHALVSSAQQAMRAAGVQPGDRVAAFIPNMPETCVLALAAISLGAVWSSCSPDFGASGVLDRFGQIEPKLLFCADGYLYNGKCHDSLERVREIATQLPCVQRVVVVPNLAHTPEVSAIRGGVRLADWIAPYAPRAVQYERLPFAHPLYILFTSGTTGVPKCIVHCAGGALLQGLKMYKLHFDVKPGDRFFYYTTCNWVMWNLMFAGLGADATMMLYDGSPFARDGAILWDMAETERFTHFGTSAKYIDAISKRGLRPRATHRLNDLRMIISTGSQLVPESFDYVYRDVKKDVCLSSISGGTDLLAGFADANPILPVYRGELQCRSLGMDVQIFDEHGRPQTNKPGELVCTRPFPSVPLGFWNDPGDRKFYAAYFEHHPGVWTHGDWAMLTERGTMYVYGRSDATLNPGGVRIGTAEIYRQVEKIDAVEEAVVIGQQWQGDVRVVLFVKLRPGMMLSVELQDTIRRGVREHTTPRHVPDKIIQVSDIPRTKNNKVVELAVKAVVHGWPVKNTDALSNPEALALYSGLAELAV